jgi:hypothetical protein
VLNARFQSCTGSLGQMRTRLALASIEVAPASSGAVLALAPVVRGRWLEQALRTADSGFLLFPKQRA